MNLKTRVAAIAASTAILAAGVVAPATAAGPTQALNPNPYCALEKRKPSEYNLDSRVWAFVFRPFCGKPVPRIPYGGR